MIPDDTPVGTIVVQFWDGDYRGITTTPVDSDQDTVRVRWEDTKNDGWEDTNSLEVSYDQDPKIDGRPLIVGWERPKKK